jgi:carboxymethylenebutenolidase
MSKARIAAADGTGAFSIYVAEPAGGGPAPAIIVILEIRGVNANLRGICDDYAARGYLAVAPDLLWRFEPGLDYDPDTEEGWKKAMAIHAVFSESKAMDDLMGTLAWVEDHPLCNGTVGALGYCLGGKLAYLMAARSEVKAAVGYYGIGIDKMLDEAANIAHPMMLHIAGLDRFVPPEAQAAITDRLKSVPGAEAYIYDGADHAFARKDGIRYLPDAARLADRRTQAFLDRNLNP